MTGPRPRNGFTLLELAMALALFAVLAVTTTSLVRALLLAWSGEEKRAGIDIDLARGLEAMVRDLRKANQIQSTAGFDEIRFRQSPNNYYIFYLYHPNDAYVPPPQFNQSSYELRKATLTGGLSGSFTYGSGSLIVNGVVPPPSSDLSLSGNRVTMDLSLKRGDETIRSRTQVRPRNV